MVHVVMNVWIFVEKYITRVSIHFRKNCNTQKKKKLKKNPDVKIQSSFNNLLWIAMWAFPLKKKEGMKYNNKGMKN